MDTKLFDRHNIDRLNIERLSGGRFSGEDLEETLVSSTPLLAVVGAGDLAIGRLRAARSELVNRAATFDRKALREQAQASLAEGIDALQAELMAAPEQLKALPERAQEWPTRAQSMLADLVSTAFSAYGELAVRGKAVVTQSRETPATEMDEHDDVLPVTRPVPPVEAPAARPSAKAKRAPAAVPDTARAVAAKTTAAKAVATKPKAKAKKSAAKKAPTAKKTSGPTSATASEAAATID